MAEMGEVFIHVALIAELLIKIFTFTLKISCVVEFFLRVTRIIILHMANREKVTEEMAMGLMPAKCVWNILLFSSQCRTVACRPRIHVDCCCTVL